MTNATLLIWKELGTTGRAAFTYLNDFGWEVGQLRNVDAEALIAYPCEGEAGPGTFMYACMPSMGKWGAIA